MSEQKPDGVQETVFINGDPPAVITAAGNTWSAGAGAPVAAGVTAGDMYFRTSNGTVYRWNGSAWSLLTSISGTDGITLEYDFATDGGATGSVALRGGPIPANFIVSDVSVDCKTAFTSLGAATTAFTTGQSAGDIQTTTLISNAGNLGNAVEVNRVAVDKKMTASRAPALVVAGAALTAGKFSLHVKGWQGSA